MTINKNKKLILSIVFLIGIGLYFYYHSTAHQEDDAELSLLLSEIQHSPTPAKLDSLNLKVRAIWTQKCYSCHNSEKMKADLALDTYEGVLAGGKDGPVIKINKSGHSEMIRRLKLQRGNHDAMPPKGEALSALEIKTIAAWIDHGAIWAKGKVNVFNEAPLVLHQPKLHELSKYTNPVDIWVDQYFKKNHIKWNILISDEKFIRKVYLDVIGLAPGTDELMEFINDKSPDKRIRLVEHLLDRDEDYATHWLSFWNDLLRNDYTGTGFITEGRKQISGWLFQSLLHDTAYTTMIRSLIHPYKESEGFIQGIQWRGEVNASQRTEMQAAQNVSQSLLGLNLKCASCHNSFVNNLSLEQSYGFASVFAKQPLEMNRCDIPMGKKIKPAFLYPSLGSITQDSLQDRLEELAQLLTSPDNGRLYRTLVNRMWHQLFGRGIISTLDNMDGKAWSQDLLDALACEFRDHNTSIKNLLKSILQSNAYQLPSVDYKTPEEMNKSSFLFKGPAYKKLHAEQVIDVIGQCIQQLYEGVSFDPSIHRLPAQWIWYHEKSFDRTVLPKPGKVYFRKIFNLTSLQKIKSAKLIATAEHGHQTYLNEKEITSGNDYRYFEIKDIKAYLQPGRNVIAVEAINDAERGEMANPAGLLFLMQIIKENKDTSLIYSDESWLSTKTDEKDDSWKKIKYNDHDWKPAHQYYRFTNSPWGLLTRFRIDSTDKKFQVARAAFVQADPFSLALGRPTRENVTTKRSEEPGLLQTIALTNNTLLHTRIKEGSSRLFDSFKENQSQCIEHVYLKLLSRHPSSEELKILSSYFTSSYKPEDIEDLIWSIIASPEFQYL
jgi:Protein of unknown function (DUF1549)/Protein of unknown function (DUF1553)/Planctomycete cytochrome C